VDEHDRAIFQERVLRPDVSEEDHRAGRLSPIRSWAEERMSITKIVGLASPAREGRAPGPTEPSSDQGQGRTGLILEISLSAEEGGGLEKRLRFQADGSVEAHFSWNPLEFPEDAVFSTELSVAGEVALSTVPTGDTWRFPVATFSKSERGFDKTVQGESILVRWPATVGTASVQLRLRRNEERAQEDRDPGSSVGRGESGDTSGTG
jgi:hypothetical protein